MKTFEFAFLKPLSMFPTVHHPSLITGSEMIFFFDACTTFAGVKRVMRPCLVGKTEIAYTG